MIVNANCKRSANTTSMGLFYVGDAPAVKTFRACGES